MFCRATAQNSPRGDSSGSGEASASDSSRVKPTRSEVEQRRPGPRLGEARQDEAARMVHGDGAILFAERVVEEARQHVTLLDRRAEPLEEAMLRRVMHDQVGAGDQQLRGNRDRAGVGDDAVGRS